MFDPAGIGFAPREHRQFPIRPDFSKHRMNEENASAEHGQSHRSFHVFISHRRGERMHMLDWNKYRQQLLAGVGGLANVQLTQCRK
jgi:hypothetical protein